MAFSWDNHPKLWKATAVFRGPYNAVKRVASGTADRTTRTAGVAKKATGWVCSTSGIKWIWEKTDHKIQYICKRVEPYNGGISFVGGSAQLVNAVLTGLNR